MLYKQKQYVVVDDHCIIFLNHEVVYHIFIVIKCEEHFLKVSFIRLVFLFLRSQLGWPITFHAFCVTQFKDLGSMKKSNGLK